jgi:activator of HSP90 ATPase
MANTIQQKLTFRKTSPDVLYNLYMNAKLHAQLTGRPAKISEKTGAEFSAYNGYCRGKNLQLIKNKLIVQSWRASDWNEGDIDSTFILLFEQKGKDAVVTMVHANVPDNQAKALAGGWHDFYWTPWKKFLASK